MLPGAGRRRGPGHRICSAPGAPAGVRRTWKRRTWKRRIQEAPSLALSLGAMSSAEDYEWADDWYDSIGQAYCLTLAEGLTSAQFLARISAVPAGTGEGLATIGVLS